MGILGNTPGSYNLIANKNSSGGDSSGSASRLEVTVINNSGADLIQYRAYTLEDSAYTLSDNTVRLTTERTGIPTQGQTGLFFCQDAIPDGTTGIGIIVGMVTTTVLQSNDTERQLKVLASGGLSDIVLEGEYVVGVITRSPLADTPLEIAFNGLSHYKFVTPTELPDAPDAESTTKDYNLEVTLEKIQTGIRLTFTQDGAFNVRGDVDFGTHWFSELTDNTEVSFFGSLTGGTAAGWFQNFAIRQNEYFACGGSGDTTPSAELMVSQIITAWNGNLFQNDTSQTNTQLWTAVAVEGDTSSLDFFYTDNTTNFTSNATLGTFQNLGISIASTQPTRTITESTVSFKEVSAGGTQTPGWYQLLTQGKKVGDQTGIIGSTGFTWSRRVTYLNTIYYRVVGTDQDGFYTDTTTSVIGTIVATAQREL